MFCGNHDLVNIEYFLHFTDQVLSQKSYWKSKYDSKNAESVDWLVSAGTVVSHVVNKMETLPNLARQNIINLLDVGCGTSRVPARLVQSFPKPINLVCFDYVNSASEWQMDALRKCSPAHKQSTATCITGDATKLPFKENIFHIILDKGTLDSLIKDKDKARTSGDMMISECFRTLHPEGVLLQITDEDPDLRIRLLEEAFSRMEISARVSYTEISTDGYECFMFVLSRNDSGSKRHSTPR